MQELQVANMRSRTKTKQSSLSDRIIDGAVDGVALVTLTGMVFAIWFIAGYMAANM